MAEYIEREAAIAEIGVLIDRVKRNPYDSKEETYGVLCGLSHAMQRVKEEVPSADVVEVVRCKKCAYANDDGTICRYDVGRDTNPDGYCYRGERKDGAG